MSDTYDSHGYVESLKRDSVLEASRDLEYLCHIRTSVEQEFDLTDPEIIEYTVRIVQELIEKGYCSLATWGEEGYGSKKIEILKKSVAELEDIIKQHTGYVSTCFDYFLVTTRTGEDWVDRYNKLVSEL
ncbi:hypothetical protein W02_04000 [Nitrospira sp. KM1]|nr:hypothetical protein W02_04000 [Nitrospira sp. KM1]